MLHFRSGYPVTADKRQGQRAILLEYQLNTGHEHGDEANFEEINISAVYTINSLLMWHCKFTSESVATYSYAGMARAICFLCTCRLLPNAVIAVEDTDQKSELNDSVFVYLYISNMFVINFEYRLIAILE